MSITMRILSYPLNALMSYCYRLSGNYVLAILVFTLLTKLILLPLSLWLHRNGIKMVEMMPEINRLKIKHFGDKDTIAEETQKLYKEKKYHQFLSIIPMLVQLVMLMGVIETVKELLAGAESILSAYPSQAGGITLLFPLGAGVAALLLGLSQNRFNPLQREQEKAEQWLSNGFSIAISLFLGFFVSIGVCIYWIASNLLTIFQQQLLNIVIDPKKYVDYADLRRSKEELKKLDALSEGISKEDKQREKADYKRFFSVANKHLVFYSEKSGFYKYFQDVIEYLLANSNVIIHYVTSDPKDQIFELAKAQPRIRPYYIGEKRLITLFMKMDADIVVMTMPDIENFHLKRSYVRKDIEYIYMCHGVLSSMRTLRAGALDHYDTIFLVGDYAKTEIRIIEKKSGAKEKKLVPCGYCVIENMAKEYEALNIESNAKPYVLIAPSWQEDNILENCLIPLCENLLLQGFDVIVRPHPQYLKRFPQKFKEIQDNCSMFSEEHFKFEVDFSLSRTVYQASVLITDWSSIGYEYALSTKKPVMFIDTPMKVVNPDLAEIEQEEPFDLKMRKMLGISLKPEEVATKAGTTAKYMLEHKEHYSEIVDKIRTEHIYNFGESGKYGARYILNSLKERKRN